MKQSTGRELLLPGKLSLSVFPWIAIETGEASLGNPPGFGNEPFLALKRAKLSVKLMPLLKKQLEIGRIEIDGLDLRLKQDAAGKGNWEDWGSSATAPEDKTGQRPGARPGSGGCRHHQQPHRLPGDGRRSREGRHRALRPGRGVPAVTGHGCDHTPGAKPLPLGTGRRAGSWTWTSSATSSATSS